MSHVNNKDYHIYLMQHGIYNHEDIQAESRTMFDNSPRALKFSEYSMLVMQLAKMLIIIKFTTTHPFKLLV